MAENDIQGEWVLPDGWAVATIGQMTAADGIFTDGDWVESKDQDPNGNVRLVQLADIGDGVYRNRSSRYLTSAKAAELGCKFLKRGDVLIARMPKPLGRACIFPGDPKICVTAVDVCIVRSGTQGVNHRWLMFASNSPQARIAISSYQSGSTRKRISRRNLARIHFPVPPLPEQHRIVAEIETQFTRLDASVAALKRAQANIRRYKASVLKAACEGRLVPTEAELARAEVRTYEPADQLLARILTERRVRWEAEQWRKEIERAKKKAAQAKRKAAGLPAPIRDLTEAEWQDLPEEVYAKYLPKDERWKRKYKEPEPPDTADSAQLPDGWVWTSVLQFSTKVTDGVHKTPKYVDEGVPFLSVNNMSEWGTLSFSPCKYIATEEHEEFYRRCDPERGDVLLSKVGTIGLTASIETDREFSLYVNTALIKPVRGLVSSDFVAWALRYGFISKTYDAYVSGSNQKFIGTSKIGELPMVIPPLAEQCRIVAEIERRLSLVTALEASVEAALARARRLRQAVLKRAFEGRLVPQDPDDEPASALLERARAKKARRQMDKKGNRKRSKGKQRKTEEPPQLEMF